MIQTMVDVKAVRHGGKDARLSLWLEQTFNPAGTWLRRGRQFALLAFAIIPLSALAAWPKTAADFERLPSYCKAKFGRTSPTDKQMWKQRIGPDFIHIHHYCAALHTLNLVNATLDRQTQKENLIQVINEIHYVEKLSKPTFFMRPEMSVQKAFAHARLKQVGEALHAYNDALKVNRRFAPAYIGMANLYVSLGKTAEARRVLDQGIAANPGSKALRSRRAALN